MKLFLKKTFLLISPLIILVLILFCLDIFKVFRNYDNYYLNDIITVNRNVVTTKTFLNNYKNEKFNSFVFGSSRSQSYKLKEWRKYLQIDANPFHFDGHAQGIYGISKKIVFLDSIGVSINNALIIVDRDVLKSTKNIENFLFIEMPEISKESKFEFYKLFVTVNFNFRFLFAYLDYSIFNKYRNYMSSFTRKSEYPHIYDNINCDIWYGYDNSIKNDSINYYKKHIEKGEFKRTKNISKCDVTNLEVKLIKKIKEIFTKHKTSYKIIVSPIYDQIPLEVHQVELLNNSFGKENVFNFSGKNRFTDDISNYYEKSHYKPIVANEILKNVYSKP
tara:strand:+ start:366 stop:1364 length:999 start_codon:yes stop_codon:yes gene_type:complete